jgi:hypothetical protein
MFLLIIKIIPPLGLPKLFSFMAFESIIVKSFLGSFCKKASDVCQDSVKHIISHQFIVKIFAYFCDVVETVDVPM